MSPQDIAPGQSGQDAPAAQQRPAGQADPAGTAIPLWEVDKLVHEPARLGILTVLEGAKDADFQFLQAVLGLTKGNLSSHLAKLDAGGLVRVTKVFEGRQPRTLLGITPDGRDALRRHWAQLDAIRNLGPR